MNKSTLSEILKEYEQLRNNNNLKLLKKKNELYKANPRLQEIDDAVVSFSIATSKAILANNDPTHLSTLNKKIVAFSKEKEDILKSLGLPEDYLLPDYSCKLCKDTGYVRDKNISIMCNCLKQNLLDIEYNKSNISNLNKENFNTFDLKLYSNKVDKEKYGSELSPRQNMEYIKNYAHTFIENFDNPEHKNLLFSGGTGLGKTFLSNCIVKELLQKGKTVLYQTAPVMLDTIIDEAFNKNPLKDSISDSLLSVSLLIIDDLGTESKNSMKFAELWKIINTRLLNQNGKITKTIISTNLDLQELYTYYDERLLSRFIGHYDVYRFFGDDIRFKV